MDFKVGDEIVLVDCREFGGHGHVVDPLAPQPSWASLYIGQVFTIVDINSHGGVITDREVPSFGQGCWARRFVLVSEYKKASVKKNKWAFQMKGNAEVRFEIEAPNRKQAFEKFVEYIGYEEA